MYTNHFPHMRTGFLANKTKMTQYNNAKPRCRPQISRIRQMESENQVYLLKNAPTGRGCVTYDTTATYIPSLLSLSLLLFLSAVRAWRRAQSKHPSSPGPNLTESPSARLPWLYSFDFRACASLLPSRTHACTHAWTKSSLLMHRDPINMTIAVACRYKLMRILLRR